MSGTGTERARRGARSAEWLLAGVAAAALLAAAGWLRTLAVPYLLVAAGATVALATLALPAPRRPARIALALLGIAFSLVAARHQRALARVERDWAALEGEMARDGARALDAATARAMAAMREAVGEALGAAPADADAAFARLQAIHGRGDVEGAEWSLALDRGGAVRAWAGTARVAPDTLADGASVTASPFYLVLHVAGSRGDARAVASVVVHADPPADRLARGIDAIVAERTGVQRFAFLPTGVAPGRGGIVVTSGGRALFGARAVTPERDAVRLERAERARREGGVVAALLLAAFLVALWPRPASLARRLASVAVALAAVGVVPLNVYSNVSPLFDPLYYFAPLGGPFTATAAALGLTSALVLLGCFAVLRWRAEVGSRALAGVVVVIVAALGPFLLRDLARGVTPPPSGVTLGLWLGWEITLFLAACAVLLAGASAGRAALGATRGLPASTGPALAGLAALLAQPVLDGTGRFPGWYPALWILAVLALALTRRTRRLVLAAATVAGFGAATLVWGATVRKRVELARRDVAGLSAPDPYARALVQRLARDLRDDPPSLTRAGLLKRLTTADLAAAGYPIAIEARDADGTLLARVASAAGVGDEAASATLARQAVAEDDVVLRELPGAAGARLVAGVPHEDGATTVVVGARTRLLGDAPFAALYGLAPPRDAEAPYTLALSEASAGGEVTPPEGRWRRHQEELHGDWVLSGGSRAHAEVALRPLDALVQRGALVVLLDLGIVALLWFGSAVADGGVPRWVRLRRREKGGGSYRARLTVALLAFSLIPAIGFAVWSYRRLLSDDRQARSLLVRESLRAVSPETDFPQLAAAADRVASPLFVFERGTLLAASDTLLAQLAPLGLRTRADVHRELVLGDEPLATREEALGDARTLVGYRLVGAAVIAAPARADELGLDRRRRDLAILVLFATAVGALASLWLSGIAARELARPIGTLREAALAIAAGRGEPIPGGAPPREFVPVFTAFRRMAADLATSRTELEEAQRRTEAVLRNVASGVVAADGDAKVVLANPRAEALLGAPIAPGEPRPSSASPEIATRLQRFIARGADEEEFDAEAGARRLHARLTRLARGGAVLTLDDVTELARAQRVLAWGEMARQVAHEIKNPLTPIRLGVQHLRRAHADRRPDFDTILGRNVERILAEIDRLDEIARAFSRYGTAPDERPAAVPTDVAAVLRGVVALERMGESPVRWTLGDAAAPLMALARPDELHEVLLNLLENARLAGAHTVHAHAERDGDRVRVVIADDGQGIEADVLPRIFEPHFSTRTSGSGLGLAISRRLIDGWGGRITAASTVGKGTTLVVELRAADGA